MKIVAVTRFSGGKRGALIPFVLLTILPQLLPAKTTDSSFAEARPETIEWIRDGASDHIDSVVVNQTRFVRVDQLAKVSGSQTRWLQVSQQACLSRITGSLCFDWGRSTITFNDKGIRHRHKLRYVDGHLYIPFNFLMSQDFEKYAGAGFSFSSKDRILTQVSEINVGIPPVEDQGDRYRLALGLGSHTSFQLLEKNKEQIWLRFVRGRTEGSQILEGDNVIREIRVNQKRKSADLIIKLGPKALSTDVFFDKDANQLVIDVLKPEGSPSRLAKTPAKTAVMPAPKTVSKLPVVAAPKAVRKTPPPARKSGVKTIVIDAGHGGIDSGAIGTRGTLEKDVNLKAAKMLAEILEQQENTRVILTRSSDEFLALSERTEIANRANADLFVSVHCNSSLSSKHQGFEVYVLASDATDAAAEAVARVENSVVALEAKKGEQGSRIAQLLASMAVSNYLNESTKCAGYISRGVKKKSSVEKVAVKEANFQVLRGAQMPSVLLELEFLSNPVTEVKLRSSRYLRQVLKGVADGLKQYTEEISFKKHSISNQNRSAIKKAGR